MYLVEVWNVHMDSGENMKCCSGNRAVAHCNVMAAKVYIYRGHFEEITYEKENFASSSLELYRSRYSTG